MITYYLKGHHCTNDFVFGKKYTENNKLLMDESYTSTPIGI